jgi:hypothetical protein
MGKSSSLESRRSFNQLEEMQRLMIGRDPHEVLAAAERVHGESDNLSFLQGQLADFRNNGVAGEAFNFRLL